MADKRYAIFEVVNEKRREIYVGATAEPIFQTIDLLRQRRPESIKDWNLDDVLAVRSVEFNLDEKRAQAFVEKYVQTGSPSGWRFLI